MKSKVSPFLRYVALALCAVLAFAPVSALAATQGNTTVKLNITETSTTDLGTSTWTYTADWLKAFSNGTGLNQANKVFQDKFTLTGSGTQTYDLDSTLTGPLGSVSFSRIYMLAVRRTDTPAASTQDENVTIGGDFILTKYLLPGADTLAETTIPIRPGGTWFVLSPDATGFAITAATGDQITFTNASSADTCNLEIVILGS